MNYFWKKNCLLLVFLLCILVVSSASAYTADFPKAYRLWQGSAAMHEIGVYGSCGTQITVNSPQGAEFDIYAKKNYGSAGTCPSNDYIRLNYDRFAMSSGRTATMYLEPGLWCVVVFARTGSGTAYVTATSSCYPPGPVPTPIPPGPIPVPCSPYKVIDRSGNLNQGQATVYGYYIPTDGRSKIDWTVTGTGSCGNTPIITASIDGRTISPSSSVYGSYCSNIMDVYVFKDCNPRNSYCYTNYYAYGPNAHVSIANPTSGSTYYVMIYARSGGGTYNIRMNSYKCTDTPIIVASAPIIAASFETGSTSGDITTAVDTALSQSVAAPSATFVQASSQ